MKIWFEKGKCWDECPKIGLNWFKHSEDHPYKGLTVHFFFFYHLFEINYVNDYAKYLNVMGKYSGRWRKK